MSKIKGMINIKPRKGDFVFLDPPYYSEKGSFTKYNKKDFRAVDHVKLKNFCDELSMKCVYFLQCNSNTDFIKELYKGYNIKIITFARGMDRKKVDEVIISNYEDKDLKKLMKSKIGRKIKLKN